MNLPSFSSSDSVALAKTNPLVAFGALARSRLSGTLSVLSGAKESRFTFLQGFCVEAVGPAGKTAAPDRISSLASAVVGAGVADLRFDPIPHAPPPPGAPHALRLLISAASSLSPASRQAVSPDPAHDSAIATDAKLEKSLEPLPLDPEERGFLTVLKNSRTVSEIFESSFLEPQRIGSLLLAYRLCGLMSLETADEVRRKNYLAGLSPQEKELREEVRRFVLRLPTSSYYDWLGVPPNTAGAEITKRATAILETYSKPSLEKAFQDERKEELTRLLEAVGEAQSILGHPEKRAEYDDYLAAGRTGSFLTQSAVVRVEATIREAQAEIAAGRTNEAFAIYEKALSGAVAPAPIVSAYARALLSASSPPLSERRDRALKHLRRALAMTPTEADLYLVAGSWCEAIGQREKGAEAYQRALSLDPVLRAAREGLQRLKPEQAPKVILTALFRNLKKLDHYRILGVDRKAAGNEIHAAYRELSRQFHPDRFFQSADPELPLLAKETYKRMVDAFMTLKSDARRKAYDQTLAEGSRVKVTPTGPTTRQGKRFYDLALVALQQGNLENAVLNLTLALKTEPDNPSLRRKLDEISRQRSSSL